MLSEFWYRVRTFPEWIVLVHAAARRFHVSSLAILKRAIALYWHYSLGPDEAVSSGLVDPKLPIEAGAGSIGRWQLTRYQRKFNPGQWECLVEDKAVFYTDCRALGLPIPELYAVLDNTSGWTASGKLVNGRAEWERFFATDLPQEFIIKPALGVYGRGVNLYRREGNSFRDSSGETFTAASLFEHLQADSTYRRFVIQARVLNHPEIQRVTGTKSLQTVRIQSWITKEGKIETYHALFKLILGDNVSDNYDSGRTGNIIAHVDPETGALAAPLAPSPDGIGYKALPVHPVTGINMAGIVLPHWSLARELVDRASRLFLPLRTIGWDIALTADGPVLIEGNMWWDPFNHPHPKPAHDERAKFMTRFCTEA